MKSQKKESHTGRHVAQDKKAPWGGLGVGSLPLRRGPHRDLGAGDRDAGCGPQVKRTLTPGIRLRECSVVLTRLSEGRRGRDRTPASSNARRGSPDDESPAEGPQGPPQPRPAPAGTPVPSEPRANREQGEQPGVVVILPLRDFRCALCGVSASTATEARKHFATRHGNVPVRYSCSSCGKTSSSCHSVLCHVPKCPGPEGDRPVRAVECEACGKTFGTRRACSIHEMHVHPKVRNRKRIAQERRKGGPPTEGEGRAGIVSADAGEGPSGEEAPPKRPKRAGTPREPSEPPANPPVLSSQLNSPESVLRNSLREEARKRARAAVR